MSCTDAASSEYSSTSLAGVMMMKKCTEQWNLYKFNDLLAYSKFNRLKSVANFTKSQLRVDIF